MSMWDAIGHQLKTPEGAGGHILGLVMRLVNDGPNRLAVDALDVHPEDSVLEMGFGPGHGIKLLASRTTQGQVYGIDLSPVMAAQAKRRNRGQIQSGRVHLRTAGFEVLPFEDASLDKILAVNVIYFWRNPLTVLDEIRRVLRPGGKISIYATDASTLSKWRFAKPDTHQYYDAISLARFLKQSGFSQNSICIKTVSMAPGIDGLLAVAVR